MTDLDVDLAKAKAAFDATPEPGEVKPPEPQKKAKKKKAKKAKEKAPAPPTEPPAPAPAPEPPTPVFGDEILTIDGTATYLKVSRRQVYELLKREELPARRVGKRWRFSKAALSAYVSGRE
jgi:excisionase family DNA binding protein